MNRLVLFLSLFLFVELCVVNAVNQEEGVPASNSADEGNVKLMGALVPARLLKNMIRRIKLAVPKLRRKLSPVPIPKKPRRPPGAPPGTPGLPRPDIEPNEPHIKPPLPYPIPRRKPPPVRKPPPLPNRPNFKRVSP